MDDLLKEFLTETAENLAVLDLELVKLEQTPNDPTLLGNIFRLVSNADQYLTFNYDNYGSLKIIPRGVQT